MANAPAPDLPKEGSTYKLYVEKNAMPQGASNGGRKVGASEFNIFISYARDDIARVQLLVSALDAEGWRIF